MRIALFGSPPRQRKKSVFRLTQTTQGKSTFNSERKVNEEKRGRTRGDKNEIAKRDTIERTTVDKEGERKKKEGERGGDGEERQIALVKVEQLSAAVVHNLHQTEYACEEEDLETALVEDCCCRSIRDRQLIRGTGMAAGKLGHL